MLWQFELGFSGYSQPPTVHADVANATDSSSSSDGDDHDDIEETRSLQAPNDPAGFCCFVTLLRGRSGRGLPSISVSGAAESHEGHVLFFRGCRVASHAIPPSVPELFKLRHRTWSMVQLCKMGSASCRKAKDSEISGSAITTVQVQLDRWT